MDTNHKHTILTLANKITILRILGVPVFILMLVYYTMGLAQGNAQEMDRAIALVIFLALAMTDALDGYFARSRNEITPLGRLLDPIADKALLLSGLILLTRPSLPGLTPHIPIWFTLLVISRDVVLILGSTIIHALVGHVEVKPRLLGKIATVLQMLTIVWVLVGGASGPFFYCVIVAGAFTLASGALYLFDGTRQLDRAAAEHRIRLHANHEH
jgi:CDP-diacylglycerol--glycerol-3-phosphate 3-phosphatidyltransferase